jgi:tyrosinase
MNTASAQPAPHTIRKKAQSLSAEEKRSLVSAFLSLKKKGRYDEYVHWHHHVMLPTIFPHEPKDADYRNGAHRGPAFLPWHREFLLQVESDLKSIDSALFIPYWDWTEDSTLSDPTKSPIWSDDLMGGNGDPGDGWRVATGPFAYRTGNWPIPPENDGPALLRQFGNIVSSLPTPDDLKLAMAEAFYDTPYYNSSPFTLGFRNRLEGWITQRGDNRVKTAGSQLHNRVHLWVGGSMTPMTSPNDPVFFLHHAFIDKIWADWQAKQIQENPDAAPHYNPAKDGPSGHNLHDQLKPWKHTIAEVLDISKLGYAYDSGTLGLRTKKTEAMHAHHHAPRRSPFLAE